MNNLTVQDIQFLLMEKASVDTFRTHLDGYKIVKDLKAHKDLWRGAIMVHDDKHLIALRDIVDNYWNVDTLYILPVNGKEDQLYRLAYTWRPDEIGWVDKKKAIDIMGITSLSEKWLLRLWWD